MSPTDERRRARPVLRSRQLVSARLLVGVLIAVVAESGCARGLSLRAPDFDPRGARVVFMPAMVALYTIEEDDTVDFDEVGSAGARMKVNTWLRYLAPRIDSRVVDLKEVATTALSADLFYEKMDKVTKKVVADYGRRPLAAWSLGDGDAFQSWAAALQADYVVFIAFKGAYETEARKEANAVSRMTAAMVPYGPLFAALFAGRSGVIAPKRAALVVVDLRSNRIVRVQTKDFEYLQNAEIPNDLARLMEALDRGLPIVLTEP